jgi:hypothetical protein
MNTDIVVRNSEELPAVCSKIEMMLAKAETVPEVKQVAALASAAVAYAGKFAKDQTDQIARLKAVKLEAERKLGALLVRMEKHKGAAVKGRGTLSQSGQRFNDMGIAPKVAEKAQLLARLPDRVFEDVKSGKTRIGLALQQVPKRPRAKKQTKREIVLNEIRKASDSTPLEAAFATCLSMLKQEQYVTPKAIELAERLRVAIDEFLEKAEPTSLEVAA